MAPIFNKEPKMATGTVKFFNDEKGFGFIGPDTGLPRPSKECPLWGGPYSAAGCTEWGLRFVRGRAVRA